MSGGDLSEEALVATQLLKSPVACSELVSIAAAAAQIGRRLGRTKG